MTDVYIYQIDMPRGLHEAVSPGWEDDCTVYVNSKDSYKKKLESIDHAFRHMRREDFWNGKDAQQIEAETHRRRQT